MSAKNVEQLRRAILSLASEQECDGFLKDLCTLKEVEDLSTRLEVARLLSKGVNYIDIAEATGASTATISRVSKCLAGEVGGYRVVLDRLERQDRNLQKIPGFTLAVSDRKAGLSAYERLVELLPFLPKEPSGTRHGEKVKIVVASPSDVALLLKNGAVDLAVASRLDVDNNADTPSPIYEFGVSEHFELVGEAYDGARVATPYPEATERYLFEKKGVKAECVYFADPLLAFSLGKYPAAVTEGRDNTILEGKICLYPSSNIDTSVLDFVSEILLGK